MKMLHATNDVNMFPRVSELSMAVEQDEKVEINYENRKFLEDKGSRTLDVDVTNHN